MRRLTALSLLIHVVFSANTTVRLYLRIFAINERQLGNGSRPCYAFWVKLCAQTFQGDVAMSCTVPQFPL
jgi:hypothetical protein